MKGTNKNVKEKEIPVKTGDGQRFTAFSFSPRKAPGDNTIVFFPAMGVKALFYRDFSAELASRGYNVILADLRGNGTWEFRPSRSIDFGYREMVTLDWPAVLDAAAYSFPGSGITIMGHSLGGQLSLIYMALAAEAVTERVILVSAPSVDFRGWRFPLNLWTLFGTQFAYLISKVAGYFPGRLFGFGGREARGVIGDWSRQALTGKYRPAGERRDVEKLLGLLNAKVLAFSIEGDIFAPVKAVENICAKLPGSHIRHEHVVAGDYGIRSLNHFNWVYQPEPFIGIIDNWIRGGCGHLPV